jgi:16S rRNA (cytosine967-C5)-methyltransferase
MTPAARLQAAIEILDQVVAAARDGGPAADTLVARYFATRRYAGARDRAAVRDHVFAAIRFAGDRPDSGRAALLGMVEARHPDWLASFDGSRHGPAPPAAGEPRAQAGAAPSWLMPRLAAALGERLADELAALAQRAPLDLRINRLAVTRPEAFAAALPFPTAPITGLPVALPFARRAEAGSRLPPQLSGRIEVQDAGSQAVVALCAAQSGETVVDLAAGAGGKTLALAADMGCQGRLIACDTDRRRLSALGPRAAAAGLAGFLDVRLLDPGRERDRLNDMSGACDLVLLDAPCSGTGTWRRNPELRWRLTPARLARLADLQARLLDVAAALVRPGGRLVYAVCSLLTEEGAGQLDAFLGRSGGRFAETRRLTLTPARHGCDGFFIASLQQSC